MPVPLRTRIREILPYLLKFGTVGLICYVVDTAIFNLLRIGVLGEGHFFQGPIGAKLVSAALSTVLAWVLNRLWTFRERRRTDVLVEFGEFIVVAVIGAGIALGCLAISHYVLGFQTLLADNISGNVIGLVLATSFRFLAYRYWVFGPNRSKSVTNSTAATE